MATKGIFFGTTTRRLREGDVVETFGGRPAVRDRGTVHRVDRATKTIEVDFPSGRRAWSPAWGKEANGAVHVSLFMRRGDDRVSDEVYEQSRRVHGEVAL